MTGHIHCAEWDVGRHCIVIKEFEIVHGYSQFRISYTHPNAIISCLALIEYVNMFPSQSGHWGIMK